MDQAAERNRVFLTGEAYGVEVDPEFNFKFLKYFKEQADIDYYLLEWNYSVGQKLNKYLNTGDEAILRDVFSGAKEANVGTVENYQFWRKFYEFNKSLPEEERIKVVGIDIEHGVFEGIKFLNSLVPEKELQP